MSSKHIDFDGHEWEADYFGSPQDDFRLALRKDGEEAITIDVIPPDQLARLFHLLSDALSKRTDHLAAEQSELEQEVWLLRELKDDLVESPEPAGTSLQMTPGLMGVRWGTDAGLVDLTTDKVLCHFYGEIDGEFWNVPRVEISDNDFLVLVGTDPEGFNAGRYDDQTIAAVCRTEGVTDLIELATWENVCRLLKHPNFKPVVLPPDG